MPVGIAWEVDLGAGRNIVLVVDRTVPEEDHTVLEEGRIDLEEDRKTAKGNVSNCDSAWVIAPGRHTGWGCWG